MADPGF